MTLNIFGCILSIKKEDGYPQWLDELRGLAKSNPYIGISLALTLLSMAGTPPLAGFVSKLAIYIGLLDSGLYGLIIIGVLTSVISAAYYLKLIKISYFSPSINNKKYIVSPLPATILSIGTSILVYFIFSPSIIFISTYWSLAP